MMQLSLAEKLLQSLGITEPSEIDLETIAYHCGAEVKYRMLDGCEAKIIGVGNKAIITVQSNANERRKRFSIGHELGHWQHHKGQSFSCRKEDIGNYSATKLHDPELVADRYSADLLLPMYIFNKIANQYKQAGFKTIFEIADIFNVSRTATAIRYAERGPTPCLLVCHDNNGRRWFKRHKDISPNIFPNDTLNSQSAAFDVVFGPKDKTHRSIIGADAWFDLWFADRYEVFEETIKISSDTGLTLLTWKDDKMLAKAAAC